MCSKPLIVDLDGTLVDTDMLHELAVKLFSEDPMSVLGFPLALVKGKANLKQHISRRTSFDAALLPYNEELLRWLNVQYSQGRRIVLCTASDEKVALPIAEYLGIFSGVMASDGLLNLSGRNKAEALVRRYGSKQFDYCGNAQIDLLVWEEADNAVLVNATETLVTQAEEIVPVAQIFSSPRRPSALWVKLLYSYHAWVFLLLMAVGWIVGLFQGAVGPILVRLVAVTWLLLASIMIIRDLMAIEYDRKRGRFCGSLFAQGSVPILYGVMSLIVLLSGLIGVGVYLLLEL